MARVKPNQPLDVPPPTLVEKFRAGNQRLPLHPREKRLVGLLIMHLSFLPWALGTMQAWSQIVSFGLAVVGFIMAVLPRDYSADYTGGPEFRMSSWPKLLRFPVFWIGMILLLYLGIQGSNPAWRYEQNQTHWWLSKVPHWEWLPAGLDTPFAQAGLGRQWLVYASCWLLLCSIWAGLSRRLSVQYILMALALNGLALSFFAIVQRYAGNGKIFWFVDRPGTQFFASFVYKNHAGAYLALLVSVALSLAYWYYDRGMRRLQKSNPAGLFAFIGLIMALMVVFSFSRGATVLMLGLFIFAGLFLIITRRRQATGNGNAIVGVTLALAFGCFLLIALKSFEISRAIRRFDELVNRSETEVSVSSRSLARQAATDMLHDYWLKGSGAGSFRYLFPAYANKYPELTQGGKLFWEHAHSDWLEIPIELGLVGSLLLLAGIGSVGLQLIRYNFWDNPLASLLLLGCAMTLVHGWIDFVFQCPAILLTWAALPVCLARWMELEVLHDTR